MTRYFPKHLKTERGIARATLNATDIHIQRTVDEKELGQEIGLYWLTALPVNENSYDSGGTLESRKVSDNSVVRTKPLTDWGPLSYCDAAANLCIVLGRRPGRTHLGKRDPQVRAALSPFKKRMGSISFRYSIVDCTTSRPTRMTTGRSPS